MGKLVAVVGNTGVGKTTFIEAICRDSGFICAKESHESRPFQELFTQDHKKYALANQLDYLLSRADQEIEIRNSKITGIQDGGLEQDFHVFTKLFYQKEYLLRSEFEICKRLYTLLRTLLPLPDLYILLKAPYKVVAERFEQRNRRLSIAQVEDMESIEKLLNNWLASVPPQKLLIVDSLREDSSYTYSVSKLASILQNLG
ncbi:MAG: deoxynucleoside kinase [Anaerolineales bacterium]